MRYKTVQRKNLLEFLFEHKDQLFTVEELVAHIQGISISSVYKNMSFFVSQGIVKKVSQIDKKEALYQYIGDTSCAHHFHMCCKHCGTVIHTDEVFVENIMDIAERTYDFNLDKTQTILIGRCKKCM